MLSEPPATRIISQKHLNQKKKKKYSFTAKENGTKTKKKILDTATPPTIYSTPSSWQSPEQELRKINTKVPTSLMKGLDSWYWLLGVTTIPKFVLSARSPDLSQDATVCVTSTYSRVKFKRQNNFSLKIRITIQIHPPCRRRRRVVCNWTGPMSPEPNGFFYLVLIRTMRSCQSLAFHFTWWTFFPEDLLGSALGFGFWLRGRRGGSHLVIILIDSLCFGLWGQCHDNLRPENPPRVQ